jgi:lipid-A-disaccharide synthase-like uncharacterized protein
MDDSRPAADPQSILLFMTTEHFNLQTARGIVNAEITSRLQLFVSSLAGTIVTLTLAAQLSAMGSPFWTFALILLPTVYFLGVVTLLRILQATDEWRVYGQGMGRIRHYYLELAPEMRPYFVMPTTDDVWSNLAAIGIRTRAWWQRLLTAGMLIVVMDSIVAGAFVGLLLSIVQPRRTAVSVACGVVGFAVSLVVLYLVQHRMFSRAMSSLPTAFPEASREATA